MIPQEWRAGEVAVVGLGKSGYASAMLLRRDGVSVYASDAGAGEAIERNAAALRGAGASADVGKHDLDRIARASLLVASPGVRGVHAHAVAAEQHRGGAPALAQADDGDLAPAPLPRDHRSLSVVSAMNAQRIPRIQKRTTTWVSSHPFISKW